jgi:hypothetical protein
MALLSRKAEIQYLGISLCDTLSIFLRVFPYTILCYLHASFVKRQTIGVPYWSAEELRLKGKS